MDQVKTGDLIRQFRTAMGLTQKQLADRINVSNKVVSKEQRRNKLHIYICLYITNSSVMIFKQYPE